MRVLGTIAPRIDPWRARTTIWWGGRSSRERALLTALAILIVGAAAVVLMIRPLQAARAQALADIRTYDTLQARILAAGPSLAMPAARRSGDVAAIVAASAPAFGIVPQTVTPAGTVTRLRVVAVPYDALVRWLADLGRTSDVTVAHAAIVRGTAPGTVDADLVLAQ